MKDEITADDLFSEVILLRNVSSKTIILLESDADCNTLDPHMDEMTCTTIPAHCKDNVIAAVSLASENNIARIAGLVDRDWIGFGEDAPTTKSVFVTDYYDLDVTLYFIADLINRLFSVYTSKHEREGFLAERSAESALELVTVMATPVGVLRWLSHNASLGLSMRHFPAHMTLAADLSGTDLSLLVRTAYGRSSRPKGTSEAELLAALQEKLAEITDSGRDFCCGHDLACCLMEILRHFGLNIKIDILLGSGRAALSHADLKKAKFYKDMQQWAYDNGTRIWSAA